MAAAASIAPGVWESELDALMSRVARRFGRVEPRRTATRMVAGLVSELPTKNCWSLAEHAGDRTPEAMQHLLSRARWDHDGVLADARDYAVQTLGGRNALFVLDETGDLKKGIHTVGVQRQYTGTAGRIENSQVAVFLSYGTDLGHTLVDAELYLPKSWTEDQDRCRAAGVPGDVEFATKPALAWNMIARSLDAGVRVPWVAGDEVYGADPDLRGNLENRGIGYVLAVAANREVTTAAGRVRADALVAALPKRAWQRLSAGNGVKGRRYYDWAWIGIAADTDDAAPGRRWLLARRNRSTGELAYYRCYSTKPVPLTTLVRTAGRRWSIEENFQTAKTLVGLDEHQVRTWTSWRRWTCLCLLALAFLTALAVAAHVEQPPAGLIPLTRNEIRRLLVAFVIRPVANITHRLNWSNWRRRHQHRARASHYRQRGTTPPDHELPLEY